MLRGGETWAPNVSDLQHERAMLRWICGVKANDGILSEDLLAKLHLVDAMVELRTRLLRGFGHVKRSNELSSVIAWKEGPGKAAQDL